MIGCKLQPWGLRFSGRPSFGLQLRWGIRANAYCHDDSSASVGSIRRADGIASLVTENVL